LGKKSLFLETATNITNVVIDYESRLITCVRTQLVANVFVQIIGGTVNCAAFELSLPLALSTSQQIANQGYASQAIDNPTPVLIKNLIPTTSYSVVCTTVSIQGDRFLSLKASLRHNATGVTACCKQLFVALSYVTLIEHTAAVDVLKVSVELKPSKNFTMELSVTSDDSGTVLPQLFPSVFFFSSSTSTLSRVATIVGSATGNFTLKALLFGESSAEFNVVYTAGRNFTVIRSDTEPPTPTLTSATFTSDGGAIKLVFDRATNLAGYSSVFPCSTLLSFTAISSATCQFVSSSVISIYQSSSSGDVSFPSPGNNLTLKDSTSLRAFCVNGKLDICSTWQSIAGKNVVIEAPTNPTLPSVTISGPASVGACQSLTLDLTSSTGSAGRAWTSVTLMAQRVGITGGDDALKTFLQRYVLSPPTIIGASYLAKGSNYAFTATLCNFLSACNSAIKLVQVIDDRAIVPVVAIAGGPSRVFSRNVSINIKVSAFTQKCDETISSNNLEYIWSLALVSGNAKGANLTALKSQSQNAAVYKLPAYTLPSSASYVLSVKVISTQYATSSSAHVAITMQVGNIVALITGGGKQIIKTDIFTAISAANSYDQDENVLKGAAADLSFV
jgi:hypothetical protein